jgi:hypothetical protein
MDGLHLNSKEVTSEWATETPQTETPQTNKGFASKDKTLVCFFFNTQILIQTAHPHE